MSVLNILKIIHILAGTITLISGTVSMLAAKGKSVHRLSGQIFFWAMAVTTALGLNAGIFKPELRIFIPIAIISFYQAATGYRILFIKTLHKNQQPKLVDWLLTIGMLLTSLVFVVLGIINLGSDLFFSIVLFAFSSIGLYCCGVDLYNYIKKPSNKFYWLFIHIFRMSHGFIAAITAFLVNNSKLFPFLPQVLLLILPIALGQPIISYTIWNYNRKANRTKVLADRAKIDASFVA
ncbi:MAG: hypothetical protein EAZ47_11860 [Bacteroidetes bacterium]|nr:MAG: hypothetical protein EAY72_00630 [Bacteroidota bacterium]TAF89105.1 MAG: hypothetical protein EAZ47_11860 [Bacteroidota bacterium]